MKQESRAGRRHRHGRVAATMLIGAGLAMAVSPVVAQPADETVTVTAPRVVQQTIGRSSATGAPIELTSIRRGVSFADLDLTTPSGAKELRNRVSITAASLCQELDRLYPMQSADPRCARTAESNAMEQVDRVIASAAPRR